MTTTKPKGKSRPKEKTNRHVHVKEMRLKEREKQILGKLKKTPINIVFHAIENALLPDDAFFAGGTLILFSWEL